MYLLDLFKQRNLEFRRSSLVFLAALISLNQRTTKSSNVVFHSTTGWHSEKIVLQSPRSVPYRKIRKQRYKVTREPLCLTL